jgi:hypothetical protein
MPWHAMLDAPNSLHHTMAWGLARQLIFREEGDRVDFMGRFAALAHASALSALARTLVPKHVYLLLQMRSRPLAYAHPSIPPNPASAVAFGRRSERDPCIYSWGRRRCPPVPVC